MTSNLQKNSKILTAHDIGTPHTSGLKPKDLCGIPWRVAFALQADGWYLRSDIIWSKPNPMPESVTDRPTKSHEYVFLLSKAKHYFYDNAAIRENPQGYTRRGGKAPYTTGGSTTHGIGSNSFHQMATNGRNRRSVWTIATAPYSGAHFATFPPALIEPMVKAGTSAAGCCPKCKKPWKRLTKTSYSNPGNRTTNGPRSTVRRHETAGFDVRLEKRVRTIGFCPACICDPAGKPKLAIPCTVLDPFVGSGTTVQVARSLGRRGIGIDLSPEYLQLARQRLDLDKLDDWGKGINDTAVYDNLPLFSQEAI